MKRVHVIAEKLISVLSLSNSFG